LLLTWVGGIGAAGRSEAMWARYRWRTSMVVA